MRFSRFLGILGLLGILGYIWHEPIFYIFFLFFLNFFETTVESAITGLGKPFRFDIGSGHKETIRKSD